MARTQKEPELPVLRRPSLPIAAGESCAGFTLAFVSPANIFLPSHSKSATGRHSRETPPQAAIETAHSSLLSFAGCFGAAASNWPLFFFFISHLVVWGVTVRPSEGITRIPSTLPSWLPPFSEGTCTFFSVFNPGRQCTTWPLTLLRKREGLIWCWDPPRPLSQRQGTQCGGGGWGVWALHLPTNLFVTYCPYHTHTHTEPTQRRWRSLPLVCWPCFHPARPFNTRRTSVPDHVYTHSAAGPDNFALHYKRDFILNSPFYHKLLFVLILVRGDVFLGYKLWKMSIPSTS